MQINWFTVIAQVLNFFLLVWLLKRYLYKPILKAIDEREKKITDQLQDAETKKAEAKKERDEFNQKNEKFDQEKKALMDKAVAETNDERQKLLEEVRSEGSALRTKQEKSLKETQENLNLEIAKKTQQEVFAITRKTLADLASLSLEEQAVNIFVRRLNELSEEEKKKFVTAFKTASNSLLIRSTFELPEKQQTEIQASVTKILETTPPFQFETTPQLISGIELTTNGYKLAWSISEYLNSLEKSISETLNANQETVSEKK